MYHYVAWEAAFEYVDLNRVANFCRFCGLGQVVLGAVKGNFGKFARGTLWNTMETVLNTVHLTDLFKFTSNSSTALADPLNTWSDNKVRELISVKVLHTSLLNTAVVAFKVLPLGSYAPTPAPSPPFKTILELVLWNGLQSCLCMTPDVINVIKMPSVQYFLYLREQKKITGG